MNLRFDLDMRYNTFMLDIKFIRENKDLIVLAAQKKRIKFDVGELLKIDD